MTNKMMDQQERDNKVFAAINTLAADLADFVKATEAGPEITQYHYGQYMSVLGMAKDGGSRKIIALALKQAGANHQGVDAAMRIHG